MKIRQYENSDFTNVFGLLVETYYLDELNELLLKEKIECDENFDPALTFIAEVNDNIIAFIMGVIRQRENEKVGYVKLFGVNPKFSRKGIGRKIYNMLEQKFIERKVDVIRPFESFPNYFHSGVDPFYTAAICFFERMGFKKFNDCSNLKCDLAAQNFNTDEEEEKLAKDGVIITRADNRDYDRIIEWTNLNFKGWIGEVKSAFANEPISIHIAKEDGNVIAFSAYETNNKGTGWFGPMGTTTITRGRGIGGVLLKRCMADMKKLGHNSSTIPWVGPIPFYMHYVNSYVSRVFWRYQKFVN